MALVLKGVGAFMLVIAVLFLLGVLPAAGFLVAFFVVTVFSIIFVIIELLIGDL